MARFPDASFPSLLPIQASGCESSGFTFPSRPCPICRRMRCFLSYHMQDRNDKCNILQIKARCKSVLKIPEGSWLLLPFPSGIFSSGPFKAPSVICFDFLFTEKSPDSPDILSVSQYRDRIFQLPPFLPFPGPSAPYQSQSSSLSDTAP